MMMKKAVISLLISIAMFLCALWFIWYALCHPEASFAGGIGIYAAAYMAVMILLASYAIVQIRHRH